MGAIAVPRLSVDEYLAMDRAAELKSEYHDGEMFPIVAVSLRHGMIASRFGAAVQTRLPAGCNQALSPVRVRVSPTKFVYPDFMIVCGKPVLTDEHQDTITNPKAIVEILSPSTADYDLGGKFRLYCNLESFEEYVLVSQDVQMVEVRRKTADGSWVLSTIQGEGAMVRLQSIGVEFPLAALYDGLDVPLHLTEL